MPVRPVSVGERIKRREDPRLIRGLASYTDDLKLHGGLYASFVRSDYAAGRIERIEASRALSRPGVVAVYTFEDLRGTVGRTPCVARPEAGRDAEHPLLADGRVRWVGQPIAVVVAEDRYLARDAALDVAVEISPTPAVVDPRAALAPDAPRVYADHADNIALHVPATGGPEVQKLFAEADGVVRLELLNQRLAPVSMEGRAVLAHWDEGPQRLTLWTSTQVPHLVKQSVAQCLGIAEIRIRVIAPEVGGGFGAKIPVYAEECLLPWISRKLRRPVKWSETRTENLLGTTHGRGHVHEIEAAYRKNGELLALRGRVISDVGAYPSFFGASIATFTPLMMPGCYHPKAIDVEVVCVYTNTMATDAYRGAGRPEAAYTVERVMDEIAAATGLDPVEVRRRNFIPKDAFPFTTATGAIYDSGDYELALAKALERFDYAGARARQAKARAEGRLVGIGVATFTEICGLGPSTGASPIQRTGSWESGVVRVEPTGNVVITTGVSPHGQGQETAFAQLAADAFGIDVNDVEVLHGDTDVVTHGVGTFGSRGLVVGGTAVHMALEKVLAKASRIAAHLLDAKPEQVHFDGESFRVAQSDRKLGFRQVAEAAHLWNVPIPGEEPGLEAVARFEPTGTTFPFGTHFCEVEIDADTGELELIRYVAVDDAGRIVNPLLADGQRLGGIVQGLGQALCEEVVYDESGQLLTATLLDYALPKAQMFPRIELDSTCTPTQLNPLGAKGIGELGTIGSTPCLVSAALDALRPRGVTHLDMPMKPERIWRALQEAAR
ncbi:MAG: xanthine dehydrogenase family protein molybdopterin-binding subunit [Deltaproteobacteria bacterium]|nr:xanthine dehydrogenase family protein molybdopterin-binding subunit [Deltaproteobacteria bacterium]